MLTANNQKIAVPCIYVVTLLAGLLLFARALGQNDNCSSAGNIVIANNGFELGLYTSAVADISGATVEAGESFAPAIAAAGQTQKSVWYAFTLPTARSLRVFLYGTGGLADGDVGLTVYKTGGCLPGAAALSTALAPLTGFTSVFNDCVEGGQYLVQVSAKAAATGQVYVQLQTGVPGGLYDLNGQAYYFGTLSPDTTSVRYRVGCQSLDDISEQCAALGNSPLYSQSTWHVFTTAPDPETVFLGLSTPSGAAGQKTGFRLYEGDLRFSAATGLVASCDSLQTDGSGKAGRRFSCGALKPGTAYTFVLFFRNDFSEDISVSLVSGPAVKTGEARACAGSAYPLPWGAVVTTPGTYSDTLKGTTGCDSLIRRVTVSFTTAPVIQNNNGVICSGDTYPLPWGTTVSLPGVYSDTLRGSEGCDSLIRTVTVGLKTATYTDTTAGMCTGQPYTLPWGEVVATPGDYTNTWYDASGCDSLVATVHLLQRSSKRDSAAVSICGGQTYTLPWGPKVARSGSYSDTLRYATGCDSVITIIALNVVTPRSDSVNASFCSGNSYTLPWGTIVSGSGIYKDTLRAAGGCDSLIRTVVLTENSVTQTTDTARFCAGGTYTLPWGQVISTPGTYTDTLKHASGGCDSVIRKITAFVSTATIRTVDTLICSGQAYTLPSGRPVTSGGVYRDTLKAGGGCDSVVYVITLRVNEAATSTVDTTIAAGTSYVLPWGTAVTAGGTYSDTLYYPSGCDSMVRIVRLTVSDLPATTLTATVCSGQQYILPWGPAVSAAGSYRDTVKSAAGLDSALVIVNLNVQTALTQADSVSICKGQPYTLPWGVIVSAPGHYADTLRYLSGCDSLIRSVDLQRNPSTEENVTVTLCPGQAYTLPWGKTVTAPGVYSDTLRYAAGCDSITRQVTVQWITATTLTTSATVCSGQRYPLPWGGTVSAPGTYSDTLFSQAGCDSVIRRIQLTSLTPVTQTSAASICAGQSYGLPWGGVAATGGVYSDTLRSRGGCDSLVQTITLTVDPAPLAGVDKSNDIDCLLGSATLSATGGTAYRWWPSESLDDSLSSHPVATPSVSTMYHVQVGAGNGCVTEDSILVQVAIGDPGQGYLVPNAFTPDGDGRNDCFGVQHWGTVNDLNFTVYNRWGEMVFHTTDINRCWDGTYKNAKLPTGTFIYLISAKTLCGPVQRKGSVTLIR